MSSPPQIVSAVSGSPSNDLWQKALDRLDDDVKNSLVIRDTPRQDILAAVRRVAEDRKQMCIRKRWRFKKSNGQEIILRDLFDKILAWLDRFKGIGDVAMQYDAGHAALPWAAVRFLLNVAVSEQRFYGIMVEGLERTTRLIVRLAIYEDLYLQRASAIRGELEAAIVELYADILEFLGGAANFFRKRIKVREKINHAVQVIALQPIEEDKMQKVLAQEARILGLAKLVDAEMGQDTSKGVTAIRNLLTKIEAPMERLAQQVNATYTALQQDERLEILRWLSSVPFVRLHEVYSETRIPNTGNWFLKHPEFQKWNIASSSSVLLLHGIPGSGKTAIASAVVDFFLDQNLEPASLSRMAYFYCAKNTSETERSDPEEIMRSILRQLTFTRDTQHTVHEALFIDYKRRKTEAKVDGLDMPRLRVPETVQLILDIAEIDPAILVIDAIDEVQPIRRHELIYALMRIASESASVIKILVTSRNDNNIFELFPDVPRVCINSADVREDMELFVCHHIDRAIESKRLLNGKVQGALQKGLTHALLAGAKEMFLWVILQIDNLCRLKLEDDIREATQRLPLDTLDQLYAVSYSRIRELSSTARTTAIRAVSWLLSSQEALTPEAFLAVVSMNGPEDKIDLNLSQLCEICYNLIAVDIRMNIVRFTHVSVQDFFESKAEFAGPFVHASAALDCLNMCMYRSLPNFDRGLNLIEDFSHYACLYWPEHSKMATVGGGDSKLDQRLNQFVYDDNAVSLSFFGWLGDVQHMRNLLADHHPLKKFMNAVTNAESSPLFTACAFGLASLLERSEGPAAFDWNLNNEAGQTGLYLASANGHEKVIGILIGHGADVNVTGGRYTHPLHAAAFAGHTNVVQTLLDQGACIRSKGHFDSPCHAAFSGHHEDLAVILLEKHYEIRSKEDYDTVVQRAAEAGFIVVLDLLTKRYSRFEHNTTDRSEIMTTAIRKGRRGVVERFMQNSVEAQHALPLGAVSMAAASGHNAVMTLLLDKGLDMECEGRFGTPLRAASLLGHESTMRTLLSRGAKVNECGDLGTALQASSSKGYVSVTRLLIQEGADVNIRGGIYGNALQAAAYHGHYTVVEMLLDAGALVYQEGLSKDAMHAAAEGGQDSIVRLLLERGFEFSYSGMETPFSRHSTMPPNHHTDLLREESPSRRKSPHQSHHNHSPDITKSTSLDCVRVSPSSEKTAELDAYNTVPPLHRRFPKHSENYALLVAATNGYEGAIESLIHQIGRNFSSKGPDSDALKAASENGHLIVVRILLDSKLDMVPYTTAAMDGAASHGYLAIVDILLPYKFALEPANFSGPWQRQELRPSESLDGTSMAPKCNHNDAKRILEAGCRGGHRLVVARGLDLMYQHSTSEEIKSLERSALHIAIENEKQSIIEVLLKKCTPLSQDEMTKVFETACQKGPLSTVLKLVNIDTRNLIQAEHYGSGLIAAAIGGHHDLVCWFTGRRPRDDLFLASFVILSGNGFVETLKCLLEELKPEKRFQEILNFALNIASCKGHKDVVTLLIREGADVTAHTAEDKKTRAFYGTLYAALRTYGHIFSYRYHGYLVIGVVETEKCKK
ncbi:MAG: hypothetical protein Q9224_003478 [Gallowayella concinna]